MSLILGKNAATNALVPLSCDASGVLNTAGGGGGGGDATAANQALQLAQETTTATQTTATATSVASVDGKITACNTGAVAVASSALPSGAATSALQTTLNASLASVGTDQLRVDIISGAAGGDATAANQALQLAQETTTATQTTATATSVASMDGKITACNTGAVVVSSSALPTGAASEATLTSANANLGNIAAAVSGTEMQCDVLTSALPTGAATSALQTAQNASLTSVGTDQVRVDIISGGGGDATAANQALQLAQETTTATQTTATATSVASMDGKITACNTGAVVVSSSALPTGAATSAAQSSANASLATLAGAVSGAELQVDVVSSALPTGAATSAAQSSTNASLATIAGCVSGTELQVDVVSGGGGGTQFAVDSALGATPTGTLLIGRNGAGNADDVLITNSNELRVADTTAQTSLATLAGAVTGGEVQVDIVSAGGIATSANQTLQLAQATTTATQSTATATSVASIDTKTRGNNDVDDQTGISVGAGASASSTGFNTQKSNKWGVVVKDNSTGNLQFILEQSWDNTNWIGTLGTTVAAQQYFEVDLVTPTGYFIVDNSSGVDYTPGGGGGGGTGFGDIGTYAKYLRVSADNPSGSTYTFDVHWYSIN